MKSITRFLSMIALSMGVLFGLTGCSYLPFMAAVPTGYVGVQVNKFGDDRGVNVQLRTPGYYFNGPNTDMFLFPTFTENYTWDAAKKDDPKDQGDESFNFQVDGAKINTDVGASFSINQECTVKVFQKYRKGIGEIRSVVLRNIIRDALNTEAARLTNIDQAYGKGRNDFQIAVENAAKKSAGEVCINLEDLAFVNNMRLPPDVQKAIDDKVKETRSQTARKMLCVVPAPTPNVCVNWRAAKPMPTTSVAIPSRRIRRFWS